MIKCDITAQKYEVSEDLEKYINKKLGRLDRFLPKEKRHQARIELVLSERHNRNDRYECDAVLILGKDRFSAKESTLNMFAAVDIVEAKLKNQIMKLKTRDEGHKKFGSGYHRAAIKRAIFRNRFTVSEPDIDPNPDRELNR